MGKCFSVENQGWELVYVCGNVSGCDRQTSSMMRSIEGIAKTMSLAVTIPTNSLLLTTGKCLMRFLRMVSAASSKLASWLIVITGAEAIIPAFISRAGNPCSKPLIKASLDVIMPTGRFPCTTIMELMSKLFKVAITSWRFVSSLTTLTGFVIISRTKTLSDKKNHH